MIFIYFYLYLFRALLKGLLLVQILCLMFVYGHVLILDLCKD